MAKKSVKLGLRSGSAVESGDVNVTYNGFRIAGLSESTTATLETENTIVEHDIEIEYTRPEAPTVDGLIIPGKITVDNNSDNATGVSAVTGQLIYEVVVNGVSNYYVSSDAQPISLLSGYIPSYNERYTNYSISFTVYSYGGDSLVVKVNDTPISYNTDGYTYTATIPANQNPEPLTITITDK